MSAKFELSAEPRTIKGTGASRRLRREGKVPGIIYGADKDPIMVVFDHNTLYRNLQVEAFHTSILTVTVDKDTDQAILRDYQMHPYKPELMHVDLQRISATEKIHMRVPLHFSGGEVAPGVKQQGGILSHLMTEVDVTCLPAQLPEYLTVDVSNLEIGDSIHLSDLPLPEGVTITTMSHGGDDLAVATVSAPRVIEEEEVPVAEAAAEGEAAEAAEAGEEEEKKAQEKKAD